MNNFFQGMQGRDEASASNQRGPRHGGLGEASLGFFHMKAVRLEFPRYDSSEDATIWLCRAKQYFEFQSTREDEKVKLASYHMEGDAQIWIQRKKLLKANVEWEEFKSELMLRFGSAPYEDRFGELCKLRQTSTVREYQSRFERVLGKAGTLTDQLEMACFLRGLKEMLRADVQAQNPTKLSSAIAMGRIYEGKAQEGKKGPSDFRPNSYTSKSSNQGTRVMEGDDKRGNKGEVTVRHFTLAELQKRRE